MKKKGFIILLGSLIVLIFFFSLPWSKSTTSIKEYLNSGELIDSSAKDIMPVIDDLPQYEAISYKYNHSDILFFQSDAMTLVVEYDDETYEKEKAKLSSIYTFYKE